jgi:hypothetical protein
MTCAQDPNSTAETNFNVYNLFTLFLTKPKIKALLELLNPSVIDDNRLRDSAVQSDVRLKYTYCLTGALGVGKTTVANLLRNLNVLYEWQEIRPEILARPWDSLTEDQRKEADALLLILDGRTVDEGAAFELGIAYWRGKRCVGLQTDPRRLLPMGNNPMIACALERVFLDSASVILWAKQFINTRISTMDAID